MTVCLAVDEAARLVPAAVSSNPTRRAGASTVDEAARLVPAAVSSNPTRRAGASTIHFFDPSEPVAFLCGNLPHWRQDGATYFVTFRLGDALPQKLLEAWLDERTAWHKANPEPHTAAQRREYCERFPARYHTWLDQGFGSCILSNPMCNQIVEEVLHHFDGLRYRLGEHVVMPNHVHALVTPFGAHRLSEILHTWKSYSAHEIAKTMGAANRVSAAASGNATRRAGASTVDEAARLVPAAVSSNATRRAGASTVDEAARLVPAAASGNATRRAGGSRIWQQESFDHIVRTPQSLRRIIHYIRNNPKGAVDEAPAL